MCPAAKQAYRPSTSCNGSKAFYSTKIQAHRPITTYPHSFHRSRQRRANEARRDAHPVLRADTVHRLRRGVDPRRLARVERREPGLHRLEDLLLRVELGERLAALEALEEDALADFGARGRLYELDACVFAVFVCCLKADELVKSRERGKDEGVRIGPWRRT